MVIDVKLGQNSYQIIIQKGAINHLADHFDLDRKILLISDDLIPNEYVLTVLSQLKNGFVLRFPHGEESKNLETYQKILSTLKEHKFDRHDAVIALGGGLTSDIAGFAASSYMRGIDFYVIPTTLLAQVDASVGGKVAVNFEGIKNLVGAFYQPKGVLIDINTLQTLDKRLFNEGMAEVIKMAATSDKDLFHDLEKMEDVCSNLEYIIYHALLIKKNVVEQDEKEHDLRKVLNFGHTIGHAIEAKSNGELYHGECVAIGMLYLTKGEAKNRIKGLLEKFDLSTNNPYSVQDLRDYILLDKKNDGEQITVVEVNKIGTFDFNKLTHEELLKLMEEDQNEK